MKDMSKAGGGMDYMAMMPESYNVIINNAHSSIETIAKDEQNEEAKQTISQLLDLALLAQGLLKGEELTSFINRSYDFLKNK